MSLPPWANNWKVKALVQKSISYLPAASHLNLLLQTYVTGSARQMDDWYQLNILQAERHLSNWRTSGPGSACGEALELGTGWHLTVPLCLAVWGVERVTTIDRTRLVRPKSLAEDLRQLARLLPVTPSSEQLDPDRFAMLEALAGRSQVYPSDLEPLGISLQVGDASQWRGSRPIDLFVSNNVFEHVHVEALYAILKHYRSIASTCAVMSHYIDLADHYALFDPSISTRNFLRFSDRRWRLWDNELVPQNRLQLSDYREAHVRAGFEICHEDISRAGVEALGEIEVDERFLAYPTDELLVENAWVVSRPAR